MEALIDTGASVSVIHHELCSRLRKVTTPPMMDLALAGVGSFGALARYVLTRRDISRLAPFVRSAMVHKYVKNKSFF